MFLLKLSHKTETYLPNLQSEPIVIPISFSHKLDVIHAPSRSTSMGFFVLDRIWTNLHMVIGKPKISFIYR